MNIAQMHIEFKITGDKVDSSAYPEFEPWEIDFFLNEAEARLKKQRYGLNNPQRAGFEENQKRTEDLKNIVITKFASITASAVYTDMNVYVADISDLFDDASQTTQASEEYQFYIKGAAEVTLPNCTPQWFKVKQTQQDDVLAIKSDPFNKPTPRKPIMFFEDGNIYIWTSDTASISNFRVTFMRRTLPMNLGNYNGAAQDCELSDHLHKEIVQAAVQIALENIESPRQQTQEVNVIKSE